MAISVLDLWAASCANARRLWLTVFVAAGCLFLLTAQWSSAQISDAYGAAWGGWQLLHSGTPDVSTADGFTNYPGLSVLVVDGELRVSRTMGVILAGLPGHALLAWTGAAATTSATLAAALLCAAAVANLAVALREVVSPAAVLVATAATGFGTALWTVGADQLWAHGPDAFWLSLALAGAARRSPWLAGCAFAGAVMTRPHLALVAVVVGSAWIWRERSLRVAAAFALPGGAALLALRAWNTWYLGSSGVGASNGYAAANASRSPLDGTLTWLEAVAGALVSPACGVLLYTPVVAVAAWAARRHLRAAPWWATAAAAGGLLYLVVQMRISPGFDGGGGFFGNRYAIEPLVLATPFAACVLSAWAASSRRRLTVVGVAVAAGICLHAYAELLPFAMPGTGTAGPWEAWYPLYVARAAGLAGAVAAAALLGVIALVPLVLQRRPSDAAAQLIGAERLA